MKFPFYRSLCAESCFICSQGASCRSLTPGPSAETPWCEMAVPTPQLWGLCAELLCPALWFKMAAGGTCAEMLIQHYDLEPRAAQLSLSCENPPIPQLTGITHSSPRGAFRRNPVLYSTFYGHKPYLTEGLPRWLSGGEPACQCRRLALIPGSGRSPGAEIGSPLHYSCLGNPIDSGAWRAAVHGVAKGQTWLSAWAHTHLAIGTLWPLGSDWGRSVTK